MTAAARADIPVKDVAPHPPPVASGDQQVTCFQWQSPLHWFGVTLGSTIWLAISGGVLLARGHRLAGAVFVSSFAVLAGGAWAMWARRAGSSADHSWQGWLLGMWVVGLVATAVTHVTDSYTALNLDAAGLLFLYAAIGLGVPLLIADSHCRQRSSGQRGVFGALFDIIASFV
jgi:hypothetical protein